MKVCMTIFETSSTINPSGNSKAIPPPTSAPHMPWRLRSSSPGLVELQHPFPNHQPHQLSTLNTCTLVLSSVHLSRGDFPPASRSQSLSQHAPRQFHLNSCSVKCSLYIPHQVLLSILSYASYNSVYVHVTLENPPCFRAQSLLA